MQTLEKIKKLISQGDLSSAFLILQSLLLEKNYDDQLLRIFAALSVQLGESRIRDCLIIFEKISPLHGLNSEILLLQRNLLHTIGDIERAVQINRSLCESEPNNLDYLYELGVLLNQIEKYTEAINTLTLVTDLNSSHADAFNERGISYKNTNQTQLARSDFLKSIAISPSNIKGIVNLGNLLCDLGLHKEALEQYRHALTLNNKNPILHKNMGYCFYMLGMHDDAIQSFQQAVILADGAVSYKFELASALYASGRLRQAAIFITETLQFDGEHAQSWELLGKLLSEFIWYEDDEFNWSIWVLRLLSMQDKCRPRELAKQSIAFLKRRTHLSNFTAMQWSIAEVKEFSSLIQSDAILLSSLMALTPIPDYEIESLLTSLRLYLLSHRFQTQIALPANLQSLLATMALQCNLNEFIYKEIEQETQWINFLQNSIESDCEATGAKEDHITDLLLLATYRPLIVYELSTVTSYLKEKLPHIYKSLIGNVIVEQHLATEIKTLGVTSAHYELQQQYEENPYPQWTTSGFCKIPINIIHLLSGLRMKTVASLAQDWPAVTEVLIAGCGTGEQSISTARRIANSKVTAIDISKRSLAYAKRKSLEMNVSNIEYIQCDLLRADHLGRQFDVIESLGVLHHLATPKAGLSMLVKVLKPGGFIKLGLYSKKARAAIIEHRKNHHAAPHQFSTELIRKHRNSLFNAALAGNSGAKNLIQLVDFYGTSNCRDLLLNVSEVQYDLIEIATLLKEHGLDFIGFEGLSSAVMEKFRKASLGENIYSLPAWDQYESMYPHTFAAMYQFWCVKH